MSAGALSALFESAPGAIFERHHLERGGGGAFQALRAAGLVCDATPATETLCTDCGSAHAVAVEWSEARKAFGRYCPDGAGWTNILPERLQRYAFDTGRLLRGIASGLGLTGRPETLVEEVCWRVGFPSRAGVQFAVIVAREMDRPSRLLEIAGALQRRLPQWKGIVLCGAAPTVSMSALARGFGVAAIDELIEVQFNGDIAVDLDAVDAILGVAPRGRGEHGAPSRHPKLAPLIDERFKTGARLETPSAEARLLLSNAGWAHPRRELPAFDALRMLVARRWKALD